MDFDSKYKWMDEFDVESCCKASTMVDRGDNWHFPPDGGNPSFRSFNCCVCGCLWFKDDNEVSPRFYTHRTTWKKEHPVRIFVHSGV